jgi:CDP-2,3-bis-(O-geranylgeranyl)-sn-glycerol synthase
MDDIWFAIWFFLPAGVANVTPILVAKLPAIREWDTPLDLGRKFHGQPIFGSHKTIRGIVFGTFVGTLIFYDQTRAGGIYGGLDYGGLSIWLGILLSFGALFGDLVKSFFKRRVNVPSGKSWFPFDQLDYIFGGLLLSSLVVTLSLKQYATIIIVWFALHLISSYVGYLLKLKKDPI